MFTNSPGNRGATNSDMGPTTITPEVIVKRLKTLKMQAVRANLYQIASILRDAEAKIAKIYCQPCVVKSMIIPASEKQRSKEIIGGLQ